MLPSAATIHDWPLPVPQVLSWIAVPLADSEPATSAHLPP
jgi:hypothetical protein